MTFKLTKWQPTKNTVKPDKSLRKDVINVINRVTHIAVFQKVDQQTHGGDFVKIILTDFKSSFTVRLSNKFAPHLKRVAALPCEMLMSENKQ